MKMNRLAAMLIGGSISMAASWSAQATLFTLTTAGDDETIGTAVYTQVPQQPTGSGFIHSFVKFSSNADVVEAYNTTVDNVFQNGASDTFNRQITVGQVGFIDEGGGPVMRFLLDINQTGSDSLLSLDEVQIFISTDANQSVTTFDGAGLLQLTNSRLVHRLDFGTDNRILLDASLNSGSGSGDMTLDIPFALFTAAFSAAPTSTFDSLAEQNGAFVYLYSKFGSPPDQNNDGFEEWAHFAGNPIGEEPCVVNCGPRIVPEPGGLSLLAIGLLGAAVVTRSRRRKE